MQITEVEAVFRSLKSELGLRPIWHQGDNQIRAHLFIAVLAYHAVHVIRTRLKLAGNNHCWASIRNRLQNWVRITTTIQEVAEGPTPNNSAGTQEACGMWVPPGPTGHVGKRPSKARASWRSGSYAAARRRSSKPNRRPSAAAGIGLTYSGQSFFRRLLASFAPGNCVSLSG